MVRVSDSHLYPMRFVTKVTGLTSDTIRAWERRYSAILPDRSAGNTRLFSAEDVRRLTLLKEATEQGHAISAIAPLDVEELSALVNTDPDEALTPEITRTDPVVSKYLNAIIRFETTRAMSLLRRAAATLEPREFALTVAAPILRDVGRRWASSEIGIAQEHIVSGQMAALLASIPTQRFANAPAIMLATPPQHLHQFGLLIGALLVGLKGFEVINLGADLPFEELAWAFQMAKPQVLAISVARAPEDKAELGSLSRGLAMLARQGAVWVGCARNHPLVERLPKLRYFHDFGGFDRALDELLPSSPS